MKPFIALLGACIAATAARPSFAQATPPPSVGFTTIAQTGQTVPGQSYTYRSFVGNDPRGWLRPAPSINNAGHVAASASFNGNPSALTLFRGPADVAPIATTGATYAVGLPFGFQSGNVVLSDERVGFLHELGTVANGHSVFEGPIGSGPALLAREESPIPGTSTIYFSGKGTPYDVFSFAAHNPTGTSVIVASIQTRARPLIPQDLASAVMATTPAAGLRAVVSGGDPVPGSTTGERFTGPLPAESPPAINADGKLLFHTRLLDPATGLKWDTIWTATANDAGDGWNLAHVATSKRDGIGQLPPGWPASLNSAGDVAFTDGYYVYARRGALRETLLAPGQRLAGEPERYYKSGQSAPLLAENGHIALLARVEGPGTSPGTSALIAGPADGPRVVAEQRTPTGFGDGSNFTGFGFLPSGGPDGFATNALGQVAVPARAESHSTSGALIESYYVLLATDPAGARHTLLRTGGTYPTASGLKVIQSFNLNLGSNNHDGRPSSFNDLGQLAVHLTFTDNTDALVIATLPSALPGDADNDLGVDVDDFARFLLGFDKPGDRTTGDFDYDGAVDLDDFRLLYAHFGHAYGGPPLPVPPEDWAALDAFAAAHGVPEPAATALLLPAAVGALRRRRRPTP